MSAGSPLGAIGHARNRMRRAALRRNLQAIAAGKRETVAVDILDVDLDAASVLHEVSRTMACDGIELQRLTAFFRNSGIADAAVGRLRAKSLAARRQSATLVGALRMPQAVGLVAPLLASTNRPLAEAAARALGRIGGHQSAKVLLGAMRRGAPRRMLVSELARAAPDLFLELALSEPHSSSVKPAAALAAGLRRRQTAIGPLLGLLAEGGPRERAISCRALGWIGSPVSIPAVTAALYDEEWKVRLAATKAIRQLHAGSSYFDVDALASDPNPRVKQSARVTLRHLLQDARHLRWR